VFRNPERKRSTSGDPFRKRSAGNRTGGGGRRTVMRMNRRWAAGLVAVLVAAGLGACGDSDDGGSTDAGGRPLLPAGSAGGATSESAAMAADTAGRSMIAPAQWREYRIGAGVDAPATEAPAYRLVPRAISESDLLEALGDPEGTVDLQDGRWGFFREDATADTAVSSEPACAPDETCREYEAPPPPPGVPSAAEAEARFTEILDALDLDPAAGTFDTYDAADTGPVYQRTVTFRPEIDGVPVVGLDQSIAFGENGRVEWANGFTGTFEKLGDYPLVALDEALDRQQALDGRMSATATGAAEPATDMPAVAEDAAEGSGGGTSGSTGTAGQTEPAEPATPVEPDPGVEPVPAPVEPTEPEIVEITGADLVLLALWPRCEGDDLIVVPAFQMEVGDEVHLALPAVEESSMDQPDPDAPYEPCPGEEPADEPVGRPEPAPMPPDAGGREPANP
jgi:hypothetical protein